MKKDLKGNSGSEFPFKSFIYLNHTLIIYSQHIHRVPLEIPLSQQH